MDEARRARIIAATHARQDREDAKIAKRSARAAIRPAKRTDNRLVCGCLEELEEQRNLLKHPMVARLKFMWTDPHNQGGSRRLWAWRSARGARSGVPDLISLARPGLAIELKAICPKHVLSDKQIARIEYMKQHGWTVIVADGAADAIKQLENLLQGEGWK